MSENESDYEDDSFHPFSSDTGWQFHNGRYKHIFSVIEIGKMSLKRPL